MAQSGQFNSQSPHNEHFPGITFGVGMPIRALVGHFSKQIPQPLHKPKNMVQEPFFTLVIFGLKFFIFKFLP